eukprot:3376603-Ditylum_brightwellii.AAC.1
MLVLYQWCLHKIPKKEGKLINLNEHTKLMWDTTIIVDHPVKINRPDIFLLDNNSTLLVEVSVPADANMIQNVEKISKCRDLEIYMEKCFPPKKLHNIPINVGVLGMVLKNYMHTYE